MEVQEKYEENDKNPTGSKNKTTLRSILRPQLPVVPCIIFPSNTH